MANGPITITKTPPAFPSLDYAFLREQGIQLLQQRAGEVWTDFNLHDPGVQILELLCYAITDLGYRTSQPVADLLASAPGPLPAGAPHFYTARQILPSHPLSLTDYRKILVDQPGIKNAWIEKTILTPLTGIGVMTVVDREAVPPPSLPEEKTFKVAPEFIEAGVDTTIQGLYDVQLEFSQDPAQGDLNQQRLLTNTRANLKGIPVMKVIDRDQPEIWGAEEDIFVVAPRFPIAVTFPATEDLDPIWQTDFEIDQVIIQDVSLQDPDDALFSATVTVTLADGRPPLVDFPINAEILFDERNLDTTISAERIHQRLQAPDIKDLFARFHTNIRTATMIIQSVKATLNHYRNLGEAFHQFTAVKIEEIGVNAEIELTVGADPDSVLLAIYEQFDAHLDPFIPAQSLTEVTGQGQNAEAIFDGPALHHGFIPTASLSALRNQPVIYTSDLVRLLMNIPEVIAVNHLRLSSFINGLPQQTDQADFLRLDDVRIYKPKFRPFHSTLTLISKGTPAMVNQDQVQADFQIRKQQAHKGNPPAVAYDFPLPEGRPFAIEHYTSLQKNFPASYGIGDAGLPKSASPQRQAQAKQLKGYLLFFEQLLANYLSQLAHFKDLFSPNGTERTYFFQPLYRVPGAETLLKDFVESTGLSWEDFQADPENAYRTGLANAVYSEQDLDRQNRFLDHLLARFNEHFTDYALVLATVLPADPAALAVQLKQNKIAFLQDYVEISRDRGQGFNDIAQTLAGTPDVWETENVGGFQKRIARLLGMTDHHRRTLAGTSNPQEGFHLIDHLLLRPRTIERGEDVHGDPLEVTVGQSPLEIPSPEFPEVNLPNPYSFRVTFLFPSWIGRFQQAEFRTYVEEVLRRETPAHMVPHLFWVDEPDLTVFEGVYQTWLTHNAAVDLTDPELTDTEITNVETAHQALIQILNEYFHNPEE